MIANAKKEGKAVYDYNDNINLDESIVNTAHIKSIEHINHLSKEGCIYLLQNWLLSLVLCDVSFFITFRMVSIDDDQEAVTTCKTSDQSGIVYAYFQQRMTPHQLFLRPLLLQWQFNMK